MSVVAKFFFKRFELGILPELITLGTSIVPYEVALPLLRSFVANSTVSKQRFPWWYGIKIQKMEANQ